MDLTEFLAVIEDADARARPGKRRMILELTAPSVLGHRGKYLGMDHGGLPSFGYRRNQCLAMRDLILAAADDEAAVMATKAEAAESAPADDYLTFEVDWERDDDDKGPGR